MKKGDFIIIAIAAALMLVWGFVSQKGSTAAIYINGELYKKVSLSENTQLVVESEFGKNTVVIENGQAFVIDADCENKHCENGRISEAASSLVCLPNRLTVVIEDGKNNSETDVII